MTSKPSTNENSHSNDEHLKERLSDMAYHCTKESGTEPALQEFTMMKKLKEPINALCVL